MPVVSAIFSIGFVVLAIVCLSNFGLFGIVIWLLIYGCFHVGARALLRHIGDGD